MYNINKIEAAVLVVIHSSSMADESKTSNILFFADKENCYIYGKSITGFNWIKSETGFTHPEINRSIENLKHAGILNVSETGILSDKNQIDSQIRSLLLPESIDLIIQNKAANQVATYDELWQLAELNEAVPWEAMMIGERLQPDDNDLVWFNSVL